MKTILPASITTIDQAKQLLTNLHTNGEAFHPEDDATGIVWTDCKSPTPQECVQLNKLIKDIYDLPENKGTYPKLSFDPCIFLLSLSGDNEKATGKMKPYAIQSIEDIKRFFRDIHVLYPMEWHPDDDFHFFMQEDEVTRAFTDEEAEYLNKVMIDSFDFCDKNDVDVYELAEQVQLELWKAQGKWPFNK